MNIAHAFKMTLRVDVDGDFKLLKLNVSMTVLTRSQDFQVMRTIMTIHLIQNFPAQATYLLTMWEQQNSNVMRC